MVKIPNDLQSIIIHKALILQILTMIQSILSIWSNYTQIKGFDKPGLVMIIILDPEIVNRIIPNALPAKLANETECYNW